MKYIFFILIALLTISSNTFGATGDRFNSRPIVFCDDSTQSCKNVARSDAQRVANLGGNPHSYYYGLNFSTAVLEKYQMSVYQEPGLSIVTASNIQLDSYALSYANDLVNSFDDLNAEIEDLDQVDVINVAYNGFSIEFSFFNQAYANPLECPDDDQLMSASDYAKDNLLRTQQYQNAPWLLQAGISFMTKANNLLGVITFSRPSSNNAVRLASGIFDYGVYDIEFPNGDRGKVTIDPLGQQFVVVPGSIIDCNGQLYPDELEPNTEFQFTTTESLHDFARYYNINDIIQQYDIAVNPNYVWACTKSSGGGWVCVRRQK